MASCQSHVGGLDVKVIGHCPFTVLTAFGEMLFSNLLYLLLMLLYLSPGAKRESMRMVVRVPNDGGSKADLHQFMKIIQRVGLDHL